MDTLFLQRLILRLNILPTEKLVGMALALHINLKTGTIRVQQKTLAAETGYSASTVKRAIKGLLSAGVFESRRTGRAAILVPKESQAGGKNSGRVERPSVDHLIAHPWPIADKKKSHWDYDLTYSERFEEEQKRPLVRDLERQIRASKSG